MYSKRGLFINGTWRRHGGPRPTGKYRGTLYKLIVVGLPDDARAPAVWDFGPIAAITPLAIDTACGCANGGVYGLTACAPSQPAPPFGGIKHDSTVCECAADCLDAKLSQVVVR